MIRLEVEREFFDSVANALFTRLLRRNDEENFARRLIKKSLPPKLLDQQTKRTSFLISTGTAKLISVKLHFSESLVQTKGVVCLPSNEFLLIPIAQVKSSRVPNPPKILTNKNTKTLFFSNKAAANETRNTKVYLKKS